MNHKVLISQDKILTRVVFLCLFFVPVVLLLLSSCTRDDAGSGLDKPGSEIKILVSSGSSSLTKGEPSSFGSASESGSVSGSESSSESSSFGVAPVSYELYYNLTTGEQSENSLLLSEHSSDSTSSESLAHDFTKFSIVIEPNDGQFYYGSNASYSSVSDGSTTASSDPNQISSSTHYDNNGGNHYSSGGKKYDRLVWDAGDELSIWSDKAKTLSGQPQEIYKIVGSPSNSGGESKATVMPKSAGLLWGSGAHHFVGLYPVSDNVSTSSDLVYKDYNFSNSQSAVSSGSNGVYLPELNKYGIMSAHTSVDAPSNSLAFKFYPQFTALEFNLIGEDGYELTVKGVTISSTSHYLASNGGTINNYRVGRDISKPTDGSSVISFTPSADDATCSKSVSLSFVDANGDSATPILSHTQPLCFTVLLSGVEDLSNLKVDLTVDVKNTSSGVVATDKHRVLTLSRDGTPITIPACSKVLISNLEVPAVWFYEFVVTDPTDLTYYGDYATTGSITSYRRNAETGTEEPVGWSVEGYYKTRENALTKTSRIAAGDSPQSTSFLTNFLTELPNPSEKTTRLDIGYNISQTKSSSGDLSTISNDRMAAKDEVGSPADFFNLANPKGEVGPDFIKETANTYIVNAKGYYRIPLVMGNGVKNNEPNTKAFTSSNFQDYKGNAITTSPYLHNSSSGVGTPTKAGVASSNGLNSSIVERGGTEYEPHDNGSTGGSLYDSQNYYEVTIDGSTNGVLTRDANGVYWLNFHIKETKQGVAQILIFDENEDIMWSYTIWMTDYVPFNYPGYESSPDKDIEVTTALSSTDRLNLHFMPRNLCSTYGKYDLYSYAEDELYVRYEQSESGKVAILRIYRPGHTPPSSISIPFTEGRVEVNNAYYQWGRKDPLFKAGSGFGAGVEGRNSLRERNPGFSIWETIQYPTGYFAKQSGITTYLMWFENYIFDLWCVGGGSSDKAIEKTIYDPSPVGYTVPRRYAFTAFAINSMDTNGSCVLNSTNPVEGGYYVWNVYGGSPGENGTQKIYFPLVGWYNYANGVPDPGTFEYKAIYWSGTSYYDTSYGSSTYYGGSFTFPQRVSTSTINTTTKAYIRGTQVDGSLPIRCTRDEYYNDGIAGSVGGVDVKDLDGVDGGKLKF